MTDPRKPAKGTTIQELRFERGPWGVLVVGGVLMPSGERLRAQLWAISGHPGGRKGEASRQVVYTDRGAFQTLLDARAMGEVLWRDLPPAEGIKERANG